MTEEEMDAHDVEMWETDKPYGKGPLIDLRMLASHGQEGDDQEKQKECLKQFPKALEEIGRLQELLEIAAKTERTAIIGILNHHMNNNTKYGDEVNLINWLMGKIEKRNGKLAPDPEEKMQAFNKAFVAATENGASIGVAAEAGYKAERSL